MIYTLELVALMVGMPLGIWWMVGRSRPRPRMELVEQARREDAER